MKKNIDRILIMFGFLAMLLMIFFMCARGGKTEPFIRTYDLIQDGIVEPIKNFTDSIQDGSGSINADTITADTITANKIVSETLNEYIKKTDSIYADSIITTQSKVIYVDKNRTDIYTENGTVLKPYKAIQSAIDEIAALNTSDYYCVFINPGVYTENIMLEDTGLQRIKLQGAGNVYINPATDTALSCIKYNDNLKSLYLENIIFPKSVDIIASSNGSTAFEDVIWDNVYFTENAVLTVSSINAITLKNCYSEQTNTFNFSNINWVLFHNSQFQSPLNIENTLTKNIPSWGINGAQFHSYSTYQAGNVNYTADVAQEVVLNGCRWGWQNTTIPDSITIYAHNSYLRGNITNNGTVYLRNSQCQSIIGGNIIYNNFDYQISNTSNKTGTTVKQALDNIVSDTTLNDSFALKVNIIDSNIISNIFCDTITNIKLIQFDTSSAMDNHTTLMGEMRWNYEDGTLDIGMNKGEVIQQVGLELYGRVLNKSGENILNGELVMFAGTNGNSGILNIKKAHNIINSQYIIGVATEDINNDSIGFITTYGKISGINTTGSIYNETWNDSDILYYNADTPGALTNIRPVPPRMIVPIGTVINAHTNGSIFVRPTYNYIENISSLKNDSNFASYNDTLFFQVSNSDTIYADTSITADTQMDVINDTACFVIYGESYGIDLTDFEYSYKINIDGYWRESSQLVYSDIANNRIVFKADINTFSPNTVKFTIKRGTK